MLGSKNAEEEGALLLLFVLDLGVRDDYVVYVLLVVLGSEPESFGDLPLFEPLATLCRLQDDVLFVDLP